MSTKKPIQEGNRLTTYAKKSLKILMKIRDFYIKSMTECSDKITFTTALGFPTGHVNTLPRSYSVSTIKSSNGENVRELRVATNKASLGNKVDLEFQRRQEAMRQAQSPGKIYNMPRSYSSGIGIERIDEEEPCDFQDDFKAKPAANLYPRSKSYAVSTRTGLVSS